MFKVLPGQVHDALGLSFPSSETLLTPTVSPHHPGLPATVSRVPDPDIAIFRKTVVARYLRQVSRGHVERLRDTLLPHLPEAVSDCDFAGLMNSCTYARSLLPMTDRDWDLFGKMPEAGGGYLKLDLRHITRVRPLPGCHLAPSLTVLRQSGKNSLTLEAIWLAGRAFYPSAKPAWNLAKYHVLSAGVTDILFAEHPMVHFPMDAVNALTRRLLPEDHLVRRLMAPHMEFQLALNYGVLNQRRSVMHNNQDEIYTPYAHADKKDVFALISRRFQGRLHEVADRPAYSFPMDKRPEQTHYDRFLNAYHGPILAFVRAVIAGVPLDAHLRKWARGISEWVPGFPDDRQIGQQDQLARAVAGYIWNCSVVHSLDHHLISQVPPEKLPYRIRVAPPKQDDGAFDINGLATRDDIARQRLAMKMFSQSHPVTLLVDVDYRFEDPALRQCQTGFINSLFETQQSLPFPSLMAVEEMAASIQF